MTSLDSKAQSTLVRWLQKKNPGTPRVALEFMVWKINEIITTPDTVKNYSATRLGGLKELAIWLGISVKDIKDKSIAGQSAPKGDLVFNIPGLETQ